MELGLQGRVALITGGSRGIGRGTAEVLSLEGGVVAICARDEQALRRTAEEISAATGNQVLPIRADLTRVEDIDHLVQTVLAQLGNIDILVNNAGSSIFAYYDELSDEDWVSSFDLKFFAYVRLTQLVVPHMRARGSGVIINVVGNAGRIPMDWHMPGGAANSALLNYTKSLSNQIGRYGIRVVAVNPGSTDTDRWKSVGRFLAKHGGTSEEEARRTVIQRIPLGRFARPEEIGYAVAFLASDKAAYVTGTSLTIDGGMGQALP